MLLLLFVGRTTTVPYGLIRLFASCAKKKTPPFAFTVTPGNLGEQVIRLCNALTGFFLPVLVSDIAQSSSSSLLMLMALLSQCDDAY